MICKHLHTFNCCCLTASSNNAVKIPKCWRKEKKKQIPKAGEDRFSFFCFLDPATVRNKEELKEGFFSLVLQRSDCRKYKMPLCRLMCQNVDNALIKLLSHSNTLESRFYMTADKDREQMQQANIITSFQPHISVSFVEAIIQWPSGTIYFLWLAINSLGYF